jgi:hypothetical protein
MENVFKVFANELYRCGRHIGYSVKFKHIEPICKKWSKNRNPDMERVKEMYEYYNSGGYIPKFIHLAELKGEGVVCYDGNHRRELLKLINDGDIECVVDVMFSATDEDIYEAFSSVNKAVDVPEIYLEDVSNIKDDVLELVKKYESNYKQFTSKSARCRSPNFNRDVFTDNITKIYKYFNGTKSISEIEDALNKLNKEYANGKLCKSHSKYPISVIDKCNKHGLWLFLEREVIYEHIEKIFNKKKFGIF